MNKGIVMEMTDKSIIVMRQDGKFDKISRKNRTCEMGEEILYADAGVNWANPSVAGRSAMVAAVVFCLVVFASFAGKIGSSEVVAYVSLDINPSIEMGIDEKEQVLELRGLNDDGSELIQTVDFKGKTLEKVTASLLDKAEQKSLAKGEADIVIASSKVLDKGTVDDTKIAEKLRQQVTEHIKQTHPDQVSAYQVEAFAAPQEIRAEANKSGISMGKYSVYLNAKSNGVEVTVDDLKKESIHKIIKDNSDNKSAVIQPEKVPTKEAIKKLIEDEKSGELDKRLDEKKKERAAKDKDTGKNINTTNNGKTDPKKPAVGNNNNNNNNKEDDRKDDKKIGGSGSTTTTKPNTNTSKPDNTKPGTQNPVNVRPVDNKKDDGKDDDKKNDTRNDSKNDNKIDPKKDDVKKDDNKKDDPKRNEDIKRSEDDKKQQDTKKNDDKIDDKKKADDLKKEQEKKNDNQKKDEKDDDRKKESDSKKDSDSKKETDNKNDKR
ncbi:protein RsgI [Paenibacillus sp. LMG 31456]|uniref:Protein RsgI n=1 Tax=Paenibacillus foliorum TaxID=2654974 RepID=A0A972GSZ4_9BACL|nr:protein RsgI [Paenibacillus foliorum]NOU96319.1 protein RsgI [Paenibacillus foliorum]